MTDDNNSQVSFDLSYLNQVFQGNKQMIDQIIEMFIKQVPGYFDEMESCVLRAEFKAVHPLAHKAKSSITMLGLKDMESLVLEIERISKNDESGDRLTTLVAQAKDECVDVTGQLTKALKE